jgi:hypothetical protein
MNNITKTIVCGLSALALYACSSDNASAPEQALSQAPGNNEEKQLARIDPPDETDSIPESWLEGNTLTRAIVVDYWCVDTPDHPDESLWCLPHRVQLDGGTVTSMYWGTSDHISCELAEDTLTYSEYLSRDDSTVSKRLSRGMAKHVTDIEEIFRDSCEAEGGTFTEDNDGFLECVVKTKPWECEDCPVDLPRTYTDPNWRFFAELVTFPCSSIRQIEPIE